MDRYDQADVQALSYSAAELAERAQLVLEHASDCGASAAQVSIGHAVGLSVEVRKAELDRLEFERDQSLSVAVHFGQRKAQATTTDLSPQAIRETVEAACAIARVIEEDRWSGLPDPALKEREFPDLDLDHPWAIDAPGAIALAQEIEAAGFAADPRIDNSEGADVQTRRSLSVLADSDGFVGYRHGSRHSASCALLARGKSGMERDYAWSSARRAEDLWPAARIGREAAERTLRRLDPRQVATRTCPVVFVPELAAGLIGSVLRALSGSAQYRRSSFLLDAVGESVFPDWVEVLEQPRRVGGLSSASFDSEGVATREQSFIEAGRIARYRLDSYSARRLGLETTGNAGGSRNVVVPGNREGGLAAVLEEMGEGFLVTELIGQGTNLMTGDYSRGAAGFWVSGGTIVHPVSEVTIAGNLRDMCADIVSIGDDVDERLTMRIGSVHIGHMTLAGD